MTETMTAPSAPEHCMGGELDRIDWRASYFTLRREHEALKSEYKNALLRAEHAERELAESRREDEVRVLKVFRFTDVAAMPALRVYVEALDAVGITPIVRGHQQRDEDDAAWRGPLIGLEVAVDERVRVGRVAP